MFESFIAPVKKGSVLVTCQCLLGAVPVTCSLALRHVDNILNGDDLINLILLNLFSPTSPWRKLLQWSQRHCSNIVWKKKCLPALPFSHSGQERRELAVALEQQLSLDSLVVLLDDRQCLCLHVCLFKSPENGRFSHPETQAWKPGCPGYHPPTQHSLMTKVSN